MKIKYKKRLMQDVYKRQDEQLENYYHSCRICVLPLRFGAGVKGKTLEAMKTGIPIVSTSIGIEGMQAVETVISPYDQAGEFAQQIIEIYQDDKMISELSLIHI